MNSNKLTKNGGNNKINGGNNKIMEVINSLSSELGLNDVKLNFDSKTKTASIVGHKDGIQYTTTLNGCTNGKIQKNTMFKKNLGKEGLKVQIKELHNQGYKQTEIANMLGISQSTVSNYLKNK